ncbi:Fe-S cluster assembly protein SufD [Legionella impletisoli]|uniref:Fe-S cluster assembly protein SufD n=1 Tax=Legionella impletisoli TaxID=343510 RepID=A0A917ND40_9GAMM|nr:Fe-S cluster assembly protein SufD [Legionella impletisoli]GGI89463.1 Fe-S cluster assembly protein SufD [Legionella impletisoli]
MSERLEFYQEEAKSERSTNPWLAMLQDSALADFSRIGFPTRHHEEWKYTALDSFLKQEFKVAKSLKQPLEPIEQDIPADLTVNIVNGELFGLESLRAKLPAGVIIKPLVQALTEHQDKIEPYLGKILPHEHAFQALNTAIMQSGLFIYVPQGINVDETLLITQAQRVEEQAVYLRHLIVVESDSSISIIEDYQGCEEVSYFTNTMTELVAGQNAHVKHYKIQREGKKAYHIGHLAVLQNENSRVDSHSFSIGGKLVRSDVTVRLDAFGARCLMNGIYAPGEGQHIDHHTLVEHRVADCQSEQDYKGILSQHSRAVFNGKVNVAKDAQRTVAKQQNKNILLSANAEVDTKPQLEIFADDVVCTHGATVGQLDEDALFYLATRGIERAEASRYLIHAFAAENLEAVDKPKLALWMKNRLTQQLG